MPFPSSAPTGSEAGAEEAVAEVGVEDAEAARDALVARFEEWQAPKPNPWA